MKYSSNVDILLYFRLSWFQDKTVYAIGRHIYYMIGPKYLINLLDKKEKHDREKTEIGKSRSTEIGKPRSV